MKFRPILTQLILVSAIGLLVGYVVLSWFDYTYVSDFLIMKYGKPDFANEFKARFYTESIHKFVFFAVPLVFTWLIFLAFAFRKEASKSLHIIARWIQNQTIQLLEFYRKNPFAALFTGIFVLTLVYFAVKIPVFVDEASTYNSFVSKSVLVALAFYPAPNNHVLFSVLANLATFLPLDPLLAMRLVSIFSAGLFLVLITSKMSTKPHFAFYILLASASCYPFVIYGFLGRGYSLYMLASLIQLIALIRFVRSAENRFFVFYVVAGVAGAAAIPSYAYAVVFYSGLAVILFGGEWKKSARFVILSGFAILIGTLLFYLPILIVSGPKALLANPYVQPVSRWEVLLKLPEYIKILSKYFYPSGFFLGILFVFLSFRKFFDRRYALTIVWTGIFPSFIMLLHGSLPFERTWTFLIPVFIVGVAKVMSVNNSKYSKWSKLYAAVVAIFIISGFSSRYKTDHRYDISSQRAVEVIKKNGITFVSSNFHYINPILKFHFKQSVQIDDTFHPELAKSDVLFAVIIYKPFEYDKNWTRRANFVIRETVILDENYELLLVIKKV